VSAKAKAAALLLKYMKAPFLAPIARKGAFMYLSRVRRARFLG